MSGIQFKKKKWEYKEGGKCDLHSQEEKKLSIETDSEMTHIIELANNKIKTAIINILHMLKNKSKTKIFQKIHFEILEKNI